MAHLKFSDVATENLGNRTRLLMIIEFVTGTDESVLFILNPPVSGWPHRVNISFSFGSLCLSFFLSLSQTLFLSVRFSFLVSQSERETLSTRPPPPPLPPCSNLAADDAATAAH
jgi:hypothetical protein